MKEMEQSKALILINEDFYNENENKSKVDALAKELGITKIVHSINWYDFKNKDSNIIEIPIDGNLEKGTYLKQENPYGTGKYYKLTNHVVEKNSYISDDEDDDVDYKSVLNLAAKKGNLNLIKRIPNIQKYIHNGPDEEKFLEASKKAFQKIGDDPLVEKYLSRVPVDRYNIDLPIRYAVENNHPDVVQYLLSQGAFYQANNYEAYKIADNKNSEDIKDIFQDRGMGRFFIISDIPYPYNSMYKMTHDTFAEDIKDGKKAEKYPGVPLIRIYEGDDLEDGYLVRIDKKEYRIQSDEPILIIRYDGQLHENWKDPYVVSLLEGRFKVTDIMYQDEKQPLPMIRRPFIILNIKNGMKFYSKSSIEKVKDNVYVTQMNGRKSVVYIRAPLREGDGLSHEYMEKLLDIHPFAFIRLRKDAKDPIDEPLIKVTETRILPGQTTLSYIGKNVFEFGAKPTEDTKESKELKKGFNELPESLQMLTRAMGGFSDADFSYNEDLIREVGTFKSEGSTQGKKELIEISERVLDEVILKDLTDRQKALLKDLTDQQKAIVVLKLEGKKDEIAEYMKTGDLTEEDIEAVQKVLNSK